jgi:hypothetical protein
LTFTTNPWTIPVNKNANLLPLPRNRKTLYQYTMPGSLLKARLLSLPLPFLIFLVVVSAAYLWGVPAVPIHPDESTQLFTSGDAEIFWQRPSGVFWQPEKAGDLRQFYRELDAPLTRNLIALGRWTAGLPAPALDWDWSKTWQENRQAGALPDPGLLLAGRLAVAALFPFSLLFLFLAARALSNEFTGWVATLLLAGNALALLHTRRAMAESALLFAAILTTWAALRANRSPWLIALPAALALCAKQSLAALAPVGLLAALLQAAQAPGPRLARAAGQAALYCAAFLLVVALLHPFAWARPLEALQAAVRARQALAASQTNDRPDQALDTLDRKLIAMVGSLYLTPPVFAETGNYQRETRAAEAAYLANPLHSLFRSLPAGALLFTLSLFGFGLGIRAAIRGPGRQKLVVLLAATLVQAAALLALVPLPWQRYYMPLVPFSILWTAYGLDRVRQSLNRPPPPGA